MTDDEKERFYKKCIGWVCIIGGGGLILGALSEGGLILVILGVLVGGGLIKIGVSEIGD